MKKHLLLILIATLSFNETKAQYHPMLGDTTNWCLAWNFVAVRASSGFRMMENNRYDAFNDTVYNGKTYKKVFGDIEGYYGAMREDTATQKVYFIKNVDTVERLIYDFSLNLGNTFLIDFHNNFANNLYDGFYTVDSVAYINIRGGLRKYIRLHNPSNTNLDAFGKPLKVEWVESLGEIHNPIYTYAYDDFGYGMLQWFCGNSHESAVLKQKINSTKNYVDMCTAMNIAGDITTDTCSISYWGNVKDLLDQVQMVIYPNPSNGNSISIDVNNYILKSNCLVVISDAFGRTIYSTNVNPVDNSIVLKNLLINNGTYIVNIKDDKAVFAKAKLVINN
jgi:hypothetical protein